MPKNLTKSDMKNASNRLNLNKKITSIRSKPLVIAIAMISMGGVAQAQQVPVQIPTGPDAGLLLRETQQVSPPNLTPNVQPDIEVQKQSRPAMKGMSSATVTVNSVVFSGNTLISSAKLQPLVESIVGKKVTFGELQEVAYKVSDYYREKGYMVARAYIPAQQVKDGVIEIQIIEGRRDQVKLNPGNDPKVRQSYQQSVMERAVDVNAVITEADLERGLLLLGDLPGVTNVKGVLEPGSQVGTSNVVVNTEAANRFFGALDFDDFGNRYSGQGRVGFTAGVNSLTGYGDQLSFRGQTSGQQSGGQTNYGRVAYQLPIGSDGFKLGVAYASMYYRLGINPLYTANHTNGTAETASLFGTYPFIRSRALNIYGQLGYDNIQTNNDNAGGLPGYNLKSNINVVNAGVNGNSRDVFLSGGINTFSASITAGDTSNTANYGGQSWGYVTDGGFQRYNLAAARTQRVTDSLQGVINAYGQFASKNLDGSQKFYLGGPTGVRSYPVGEGAGSQGGVFQFEAQQALWYGSPVGNVTGIAFYDAGVTQLYVNQPAGWNVLTPNRSNSYWLQGIGVGLKTTVSTNGYLSATWAHTVGVNNGQINGNNSNGQNLKNQFWLQGVYQF